MTITYKIHEHDFVALYLFIFSKSEIIKKKRKKGWILLTITFAVISFYFLMKQESSMSISAGLVTLITVLYYPKYFNWRYKKHYQKHVRNTHSKRFGQTEHMEISADSIIIKNTIGEGKIKTSEIKKIDETKDYFFLKISTDDLFFIPKKELTNTDALRMKFKEIGFTINDQTNLEF
ncbi:YcxB family protein [uncultured Kordia sp.]|uniref:YcxB family protein n=1 Tax=uncultured Kordia sp. TaxID=507699 RepID=UPI002619A2C9|nr:YcxB family protein [uncultured Kordia sp.]